MLHFTLSRKHHDTVQHVKRGKMKRPRVQVRPSDGSSAHCSVSYLRKIIFPVSIIITRLDPWGHALAELGFVVPKHHGWPHSLTVTDGGRARYIVESRSSWKPLLLLTSVNTTLVYIGP